MNESLQFTIEKQLERTAVALRKNNMEAYCVNSAADVAPLVTTLLHEGDTVTVGGSVTLSECGILDLLKAGPYTYLDRYAPGIAREDVEKIFRAAFSADAYISSANAILSLIHI